MKIRTILNQDLPAVKMLLHTNGLPSEDCDAHIENFFGAEEAGVLIGLGGIEHYGSVALLRSIVVDDKYRGKGIAHKIYTEIVAKAIQTGVNKLYLLTDTAVGYFEQRGFKIQERPTVPSEIQRTKQFRELCPTSATVLMKEISDNSEGVITNYLQMTSLTELNAKTDARGMGLMECEIPQYKFNRYLYQTVGESWDWIDRLVWTDEQWQCYTQDEHLRTWVAYVKGTPAGYFELQKQGDGDVEIAYFGLVPQFIGKGYGGYLLSQAIRNAWNWPGTTRVWVHTCSLDHPSALCNYKARGMTIYRTEQQTKAHSNCWSTIKAEFTTQ